MVLEAGTKGLKIEALKEMCLETTLVVEGEPQAQIVIGLDPVHERLAVRIADGVEAATGARLEILRADDAAPEELLASHVIVLGNMADNGFYRWLYHRWWAMEDRCYPGDGGYALRTLHNPLGNGRNVVLVGASDETGLERAAGRFLDLIPDGGGGSLGWLMEIELGPEFEIFGRPPEGWQAEQRANAMARATETHASKAGAGTYLVTEAGAHGLMYHRTGYEAYAKAFRATVDAHLALGEHGVMAHFHVWWIAVIWDLIEESPVFSDEDRLEITRYLLWIMDSEEGAYNGFFRQGVGNRMVRQNHQTLVGLSSWFAGRYFCTHYGMEEGEEWMAAAADLFKGQAASFKPIEDANAYQWMTLDHILTYTLASGDRTYIENGNCRRSLDQAVLYCNNRGGLPAFGDTGVPTKGYPTNFLIKAGHVLGDGRAEFLMRKRFERPSDIFQIMSGQRYDPGEQGGDPFLIRSFEKCFCDGLKPELPGEMLGVQALEVAGGFYDFAENPKARSREVRPLNLPREEAFDTVCFREGFDPEDQYLMLHGIFYGNHSHEDGNTISEFSANDRIFLVDASYTEGTTLKHHNGVTAVRDGEAWEAPALCRLEGVADLGRVGMSRTSMEGDWGALWIRSILWCKGRCFVVVDEVEATQDGEFALQCHWRALGETTLKEGTLEAVQRDPENGREDRFVLQTTEDSRVSLELDRENFGYCWFGYPYVDDCVSILRESANRKMDAGDRYGFINLFYATNDAKPVDDRMRRVGPSAVTIDGSEGRMAAGTGDKVGTFALGPVSGRSAVYAFGDGWFSLCNGTSLTGTAPIFDSATPVSIEFDLTSGEGVVVASEPGEITLCGEKLRVAAGRQEVRIPVTGKETLSLDGIADLPTWEARTQERCRTEAVPALRPAWTCDAGSGVRSVASGGDEVVLGTEDGRVMALGEGGETRWSAKLGGTVLSVSVGDLEGSGRPLVVAGTEDRRLHLLEEGGATRWSHEFEIYVGGWDRYARDAAVEFVTAADLRGNGQADILAAVSDRQLHCFDLDGNERWSFMIYGIFAPLRVADINGDGRLEVIGGPGRITCSGTCYVLDADGGQVAVNGLDSWASMMPACDVWLGEGGEHLVACGTTRSNLYALKLAGSSLDVVWQQRIGEEVRDLVVADVNGDGRPEVVAGSDCFYLYLFSEDGTEQWRRNLGAPVQQVMMTDLRGDGHQDVVATCEDGSVWAVNGDGEVAGRYETGATIHSVTPNRGSGLLVGTSDGFITALDL